MLTRLRWCGGAVRSSAVSWAGLAACRLRESLGGAPPPYGRVTVFQSGGMGDAVLTLPVVAAVRERWPGAELRIVAGRGAAPLFRDFLDGTVRLFASVDELPPPSPGEGAELVLHLRGGAPAVRYAFRRRGARFASGLPGRSRLRFAPLHYLGIPVPPSRDHQYETWRGAFAPLGIALPAVPSVEVRPGWRASVEALLAARGLSGATLVVLHPFSGWPPRAWPRDRWREVFRRLAAEVPGLVACVVGGREDAEAARDYLGDAVPSVSLAGELSPGELSALCARAALFAGNDSGPAHLAAAAGAPCVVLYGPQEPSLFGVLSPRAAAVHGGAPCSPCWQTLCPFDPPRCTASVTEEAVLAAARGRLAAAGAVS